MKKRILRKEIRYVLYALEVIAITMLMFCPESIGAFLIQIAALVIAYYNGKLISKYTNIKEMLIEE